MKSDLALFQDISVNMNLVCMLFKSNGNEFTLDIFFAPNRYKSIG